MTQFRWSYGVKPLSPAPDILVILLPGHSGVRVKLPGSYATAVVSNLISGASFLELAERLGDSAHQWVPDLWKYLERKRLIVERPENPRVAPAFDRLARHLGSVATEEPETYIANLAKTSVCFLGMGTLGTWILQHLSISPVGSYCLVDHDNVEATNVGRQPIFTLGDVGRLKTEVAADYARSRGLEATVRCVNSHIDGPAKASDLFDEIGPCDLLILTADQPRWRLALWIQEQCGRRRIPFVRGNSLGVGPFVWPGQPGGCVGCELTALALRLGMTVDELLDDSLVHAFVRGSTSSAPAATAAVLAQEAIHFLSKAQQPVTANGRLTVDTAGDWAIRRSHIPRHDRCILRCSGWPI